MDKGGGGPDRPAVFVSGGRVIGGRSPALFPLTLEPGARVRFVELDEAGYRAASFLDERLLADRGPGAWRDWSEVRTGAAGLAARCHFIFHIGHVGSTLLSRLLGEHPALFSVREPAALRTLAQMPGPSVGGTGAGGAFHETADVVVRLLSRTWRSDQTAVVKATSFVGEIAGDLLELTPGARAVLLFANPLAYLRGVLGGPASRLEARALAEGRLARLHRRLGGPVGTVQALSEGEVVAMNWLSEMAALHAAAHGHADRVLWINFDQLLASQAEGLSAALHHLVGRADQDLVHAVLAGPIPRRYAKAPEHAYDAALRGEVLMRAEGEHGAEIRRGMDWLGRVALAFPLAREILEGAARVRLARGAARG